MADFGGFQLKTPQEVLAELNATRQAISTLPPQQQRVANAQFQIANLFGNPELKKARAIEDRMKAIGNLTNKPAGSLDEERQRLSMTFDAIKDLDPNAAAQISQQLVALDAEKFERDRLTRQAERAERNTAVQEGQLRLAEDKFGRLPDWSNYRWMVDPNGGPDAKPRTFDLSDPEQAAAFREAGQQGMMPLTQAQAYDSLGFGATRQQMRNLVNNSGFEKRVGMYNAHNQFLDQGGKLIERFRVDPRTGTLTLDVTRGIRNLAAEGKAIAQTLSARDGSDFSEANTKGWISEKLDHLIENEGLQIAETQRALYESSILNLGYVLARGLDSGGRLSDQDVNMAIRMLTGGSAIFEDGTLSVPAEQIAAVMLDRAADINNLLKPNSADGVLFAESVAGDNPQAQSIRNLRAVTTAKYNAFDTSARRVLGDELYQRVVNPWEQESLEEADESAREARRQAEVDRLNASGTINTIFRPDREAERSIQRGAAIVYDDQGEVVEVLDTEAEWANRITSLPEGYRLRYKDRQSGQIVEPNL